MRNSTVVILALAAALLTVLAFRESSAARQARTALATAMAERDGLREQLANLEKEQQALSAENVSLRNTAATRPPPDTLPQVKPFTAPGGPRGRFARPMEVFDSPEIRQLLALQQKGQLDGRYAALFKALRLSPEQLDRFKQMLVDKQNTAMDVMAAAHRQEMLTPGSRGDVAALVKKEQNSIDAAIHELLGETGYEEYQDYERSRAQRAIVDQLANRLSYSENPLGPEQAQALVDLLLAERSTQPATANADPTGPGVRFAVAAGAGGGDMMVSFGPGAGESAPISDASLAAARSWLTDTQYAALQQLQAEQLAQQKMSELMRASMPPPPPPGSGREIGTWVGTPGGQAVPVSRP